MLSITILETIDLLQNLVLKRKNRALCLLNYGNHTIRVTAPKKGAEKGIPMEEGQALTT